MFFSLFSIYSFFPSVYNKGHFDAQATPNHHTTRSCGLISSRPTTKAASKFLSLTLKQLLTMVRIEPATRHKQRRECYVLKCPTETDLELLSKDARRLSCRRTAALSVGPMREGPRPLSLHYRIRKFVVPYCVTSFERTISSRQKECVARQTFQSSQLSRPLVSTGPLSLVDVSTTALSSIKSPFGVSEWIELVSTKSLK